MTHAVERPLTGRKVALIVGCAFTVIISVNLTLAFKAVSTFPGLEVRNSYVAGRSFDTERSAQLALGWDVAATVAEGQLRLSIADEYGPVIPEIQSATFGRATTVDQDQSVEFEFDGKHLVAPVAVSDGNWNLRLVAKADDGTLFRQRIVVGIE